MPSAGLQGAGEGLEAQRDGDEEHRRVLEGECAPAGMMPPELTAATRTKPIRNQGTSLTTRRADMRAAVREAGAPAAGGLLRLWLDSDA
jgi:hypothetical protein